MREGGGRRAQGAGYDTYFNFHKQTPPFNNSRYVSVFNGRGRNAEAADIQHWRVAQDLEQHSGGEVEQRGSPAVSEILEGWKQSWHKVSSATTFSIIDGWLRGRIENFVIAAASRSGTASTTRQRRVRLVAERQVSGFCLEKEACGAGLCST